MTEARAWVARAAANQSDGSGCDGLRIFKPATESQSSSPNLIAAHPPAVTRPEGDSREEIAARINALSGVTADDPIMRVVRKTRNAQRDASHCAGCEREIKPSEPVWRFRVSWPCLFGWSHSLAPIANNAAHRNWRIFRKPNPVRDAVGLSITRAAA